jgi:hypothetical protein
MADVLAWIAALFLSAVVAVTLMGVATVWMLKRLNRVDPRTPTRAPLRWLWSIGRCARLHRRLRVAVRNARSARAFTADSVIADLVGHACALDQRLVAVSRTPFLMRIEQLHWVAAEIGHVEHLAARLCGIPAGPGPAYPMNGLRDVADRIDALDAARRDLAAVEAGAISRYTPL